MKTARPNVEKVLESARPRRWRKPAFLAVMIVVFLGAAGWYWTARTSQGDIVA